VNLLLNFPSVLGMLRNKLGELKLQFEIAGFNLASLAKSTFSFSRNLVLNERYLTAFSSRKRIVETQERDFLLQQAIITCYFTSKPDPQLGIVRSTPDIEYIAPWYSSINRLQLNGIVIHDGLPQEFIRKYENEFIQFRKYDAGNYSIFEERWFAYYLFISQTNIQSSFCTDANDVYITKNPFDFATDKNVLYIGRDNANKIKDSGWILNEMNSFEADAQIKLPKLFRYQKMHNAGVVGGSRATMLFLIAKMIDFIAKTETASHKDMTIINLVIHRYFYPTLECNTNTSRLTDSSNDDSAISKNVFSGFPLNSAFKKFERESQAIFIHK
jgi:hypothetical protein